MIAAEQTITQAGAKASIRHFVTEELLKAVERGALQYVSLGGPAMDSGSVPETVRSLEIAEDFDSAAGDSLSGLMKDAGFALDKITFVSWLGGGISTLHTVLSTLRAIGSLPKWSALVFDYVARRRPSNRACDNAMDPLASEFGEPPSREIDSQALWTLLRASGFRQIEESDLQLPCNRRLVLAVV